MQPVVIWLHFLLLLFQVYIELIVPMKMDIPEITSIAEIAYEIKQTTDHEHMSRWANLGS